MYRGRRSIIISIIILEIFAFINAFLFNLKGSGVDAENFLDFARNFALNPVYSFQIDQLFYIQFIGFFITIVGDSEFIITQINIIAIYLFLKELEVLSLSMFGYKIKEYQIYLITLLPTVIPKLTTTMREAVLMLCIVCMINCILASRLSFKRLSIIVLGAFMHKAYAILVIIFFLLFLYIKFKNKLNVGVLSIIVFSLGFSLLGIIKNSNLDIVGLGPLLMVSNLDIDAVEKKVGAKQNKDARTTYESPIKFDNPQSIILGIPKAILFYLFKPFVWEIRSIPDLFAYIDTLLRLFGSLVLFKYFRRFKSINQNNFVALILLLTLIIIWSFGTVNYGTAARHNLTTNWFFILIIHLAFLKNDRRIYNRTS